MKLTNKFRLIAIISFIFVTLFALMLYTGRVFGNTSYFAPIAQSATATSTISYMTPGTATTTIVYDAYGINGTNQNPGQKSDATDSASLFLQYTATSTTSAINVKFEFSDGEPGINCASNPLGCEWYQNKASQIASTTGITAQVSPIDGGFSWTYSSSTQACATGQILSSNNRTCALFSIPTPSRYVRVVISVPAGAGNGGVWGRILPKKQQQQ